MVRAIRPPVRVLCLAILSAGWPGGAAAGTAAPADAPVAVDSLAALRVAIADLEQRVEMMEACLAAASAEDEILRVASTDLEGLGDAGWWPAESPSPDGIEVGSGAEEPLLRFSGCGDLRYEASSVEPDDGREKYGIGQAELDMESSLSNAISLDAAIWFDGEESRFELGAFVIDFRLWGGEGGHWREATWLSNSGIAAGQFDVPFGIDWQVNTSIDRRTVSTPLVVEETHGVWNDIGVNGYFGGDHFNGTLFVLNGFDYEALCEGLGTDPAVISSRRAYGGRLGLAPVGWLEIGGSYAYLPSETTTSADGVTPREMSLAGADVQLARGALSLRGEYIAHHLELDVEQTAGVGPAAGAYEGDNRGFYTTAMYDLGRYFLIARVDRFSPGGGEAIARLCGGGGWVVREQCEVRVEYQARSGDEPDVAYVQLAVGF